MRRERKEQFRLLLYGKRVRARTSGQKLLMKRGIARCQILQEQPVHPEETVPGVEVGESESRARDGNNVSSQLSPSQISHYIKHDARSYNASSYGHAGSRAAGARRGIIHRDERSVISSRRRVGIDGAAAQDSHLAAPRRIGKRPLLLQLSRLSRARLPAPFRERVLLLSASRDSGKRSLRPAVMRPRWISRRCVPPPAPCWR